ncbi:hypothetical protein DXG01_004058, partial [Tephrocybe rancida]
EPTRCHFCRATPCTRDNHDNEDRTWRIRQGLLVMKLASMSAHERHMVPFIDLLGRRGSVCQFCLHDAWYDAMLERYFSTNPSYAQWRDGLINTMLAGEPFSEMWATFVKGEFETLRASPQLNPTLAISYDLICQLHINVNAQ